MEESIKCICLVNSGGFGLSFRLKLNMPVGDGSFEDQLCGSQKTSFSKSKSTSRLARRLENE
jgi:hypothetical protein